MLTFFRRGRALFPERARPLRKKGVESFETKKVVLFFYSDFFNASAIWSGHDVPR